jgi:hypothetical protein
MLHDLDADFTALQTALAGEYSPLDAARHIGRRLGDPRDAHQDVEQRSRHAPSGPRQASTSDVVEDDADADTLVSGVPAARG